MMDTYPSPSSGRVSFLLFVAYRTPRVETSHSIEDNGIGIGIGKGKRGGGGGYTIDGTTTSI